MRGACDTALAFLDNFRVADFSIPISLSKMFLLINRWIKRNLRAAELYKRGDSRLRVSPYLRTGK